MNAAAILALIGELYAASEQLAAECERLRVRVAALEAEPPEPAP